MAGRIEGTVAPEIFATEATENLIAIDAVMGVLLFEQPDTLCGRAVGATSNGLPNRDGRATPTLPGACAPGSACVGDGAASWCHHPLRPLIPRAPIEQTARLPLADTTPLLEEERHSSRVALVADVAYPVGVHRTGTRAGFAADHDPVNPRQREMRERFQERFQGEELDLRWRLTQVCDAGLRARHPYGHAHPDIGRPVQVWRQSAHAPCPLGEDLEDMPVGLPHGGKRL